MLSPTDEIKNKVDIVELLQEYVKMQQSGANWKAKCPFHTEKTASFMVSRDKQIWHCFGCGEGGDIFTFIQKIEGVEFPEALRILANKAGVVLQRQDPAVNSQRTRLLDINDLVAKFYHKVLTDSPIATKARDYLAARKVDQLTVDDWQIGFAPDSWDETSSFLKKKGFTESEIFLAGLSVRKDRGVGFYDRFRNRLTFPIKDHHGHVVGFSARTLEVDAKEAKYVNTPQTMVFNKGQLLFGLDKAKEEIRRGRLAVLVEGNLDVITSHQFGVKNVVASCGTALTIDQVQLLKRYTENLVICFDPDTAGQVASERGIDIALSQGLNVKVVTLPGGQDPDQFIKTNLAEAWREKIGAAKMVMAYYFDKSFEGADLSNPQVKKEIAAKLLTVIAKIGNSVEQTHWLQQLAGKLSVPESILRETVAKLIKRVGPRQEATPVLHSAMSRPERQSERILAILFRFPLHLAYIVENLTPELLISEKGLRLYTELVIYYNRVNDQIDWGRIDAFQDFSSNLDKELVDYLNQLTLLIDQEEDLTADKVKDEVIKIIRDLKRDYINSQLKKLGDEIGKAELSGDDQQIKKLSEKFSELTARLYNLN